MQPLHHGEAEIWPAVGDLAPSVRVLEEFDEDIGEELAITNGRPDALGRRSRHFDAEALAPGFGQTLEEEAVCLGRTAPLDRRQHARLAAIRIAVQKKARGKPYRPQLPPRVRPFEPEHDARLQRGRIERDRLVRNAKRPGPVASTKLFNPIVQRLERLEARLST